MASSTFSQEAPAAAPAPTRRVFQTVLPPIVSGRKIRSFIWDIPAGMEMRLRIIGMHLQKKTVDFP